MAEGNIASWITIVGMLLTAINTALAATIVYLTARDKLRFDGDKQALQHRISVLEEELKRRKDLRVTKE